MTWYRTIGSKGVGDVLYLAPLWLLRTRYRTRGSPRGSRQPAPLKDRTKVPGTRPLCLQHTILARLPTEVHTAAALGVTQVLPRGGGFTQDPKMTRSTVEGSTPRMNHVLTRSSQCVECIQGHPYPESCLQSYGLRPP